MTYSGHLKIPAILILLMLPSLSVADETIHIPHVDQKAVDSYQFDYIYAGQHRAFAIASGGAWSWKSNEATSEQAREAALAACGRYTQQKCMLYSVDDEIVFDRQAWPRSWGPYKSEKQSRMADTGARLGQRFYDLRFTDQQGVSQTLSDLKGKVVFLHFWARWCPSCRHEFGTLIDLYQILNSQHKDKVAFVVLQVREPIEISRAWTKKHGVTALPLSDSGVKSDEDKELTLKDGSRIADRKLARVFPATYVLDKNGIVVFSHMGSIRDWTEYVPFFDDVVRHSP